MSRDIDDTRRLETAAVASWRQRTLTAAGFDGPLAARLAGDPRFDPHAVLELVDAGCPPHLAAQILAPLASDREAPA